ncbi:universal stress protein [Streptomyces sp. OF3]|uniref:Universal stress protein n=1 Tax=Streptomyces alkaliterrae TaxID=2213162 RepID=A0A7W3ZQE2_9ACTN|nr:universal stress protein [Streptomyces alkaliterrae]MBB1256663.1 universal stress protein [Streptomyces alkaliterrae]
MNNLPVVAAVDGSGHSLRALEWALDAATRRETELLVVHVWVWPPQVTSLPEPMPEAPPPGQDPVLDWVKEQLHDRRDLPEVRYTTMSGSPAAVLPEMAPQAQLMVLGSRGRGGFASLLLGSNSRATAARAACPVVVVPHKERGGGALAEPYGRVVLGLETSETAAPVVEFALAEARRRGAVLQVVTTHPVPFSSLSMLGNYPDATDPEGPEIARVTADAQRDRLRPYLERYEGVVVEYTIAPGDAAGRLVAASETADVVVVGRHRRRMHPGGLAMGSVTNAVLLHSQCPVAVVPVTER